MPQVPLYDGPQVQTRALNYDQANPEAFGAVQGRTMQQAGQGIAQLGNALDAVNEREVQTQAFNAEAAAKDAYVQWSQDAVKNRQGVAAKGLVKDSADWWGKAGETFGKDLTPMAQRMLQRSLQQQATAAAQSMGHYENAQLDAAQQLSLKATTQASRDSAVTDSSDANIATQRQNIIGAWSTQRSKMDPATFEQVVKGELTQMHEAVFNKLFVDSPSQAKLYYEVNQKEISGAVKDNILQRLKAGLADEEGGGAAREVFNSTMTDKGYNEAIPYDKMDAELVKRFEHEPEKLKAARSELDRQVAMRNKTQSEQQAGAIDGVYGLLNKNAPLSSVMRTPEWAGLSEQSKRGIQQQIDDRNHMLAARVVEDKVRLEHERELRFAPAMLQFSQPENLEKMSKSQIIELAPTIGYNNAQKLLTTWQGYQQDQAKLSNAKLDSDMMGSVLASVGIDPKPKASDKEASKLALDTRNAIEMRIGQDQQKFKRELTATEKQNIAREVASAKVIEIGTIWNSEKNVVSVPDDKLREHAVEVTGTLATGVPFKKQIKLGSIPPDQYADTERFLRERRKPADPQSVAQHWYNSKNKAK